jgi:Fe2+ transport system protein B
MLTASLAHTKAPPRSAILIGFESSGKSALFRGLTGKATGEESNFRGSTVMARKARWYTGLEVADLPGIRLKDDSRTTQEALDAIHDADLILLVVRATHAATELPLLLQNVDLKDKKAALVLTFADKMPDRLEELERYYGDWLGIPVHGIDARSLEQGDKVKLLSLTSAAKLIRPKAVSLLFPAGDSDQPPSTWFEHPIWGKPLAAFAALFIFALPVYLAYLLSSWSQPLLDQSVIVPFKNLLGAAPPFLQSLVVGDYGLVTLGLYSFLWAFPVVLLLGISIAIVEESGLKDRITDSLDGWMRHIGLSGRDLVPVLSGFGCNVVAVFQSRACSACTRKSCVSLIAFGSACSYQIGASLSVFGSAGHPWLFLPYLLLLGLVGAIHTRIWNRKGPLPEQPLYQSKTFLQVPGARAVGWRVRAVVKQFMLQAMPIFILICLAAGLLQLSGLLTGLSQLARPLLALLQLPADAAGGILFSVLRKDGILLLNQNEGAMLLAMSAGQLLVLVYLASTLTACLVTLWTVRKELGLRFASSLAGKQLITSIVSASIIMLIAGRW